MIFAVLAVPVLFVVLCAIIGWVATMHVSYEVEDSPRRLPQWMVHAIVAMDRTLLGQAIIASVISNRLILTREFIAGLTNIRVTEAPPEPTQAPSLSRSAAMTLMTNVMKMASTASRVQSRMYGHVAREIALQHGPLANRQPAAAPAPAPRPAPAPTPTPTQQATTTIGRPDDAVPAVPVAEVAPWEDDRHEVSAPATLHQRQPSVPFAIEAFLDTHAMQT
jgi:hypothetical protein